jgi:HEAT repeat protein
LPPDRAASLLRHAEPSIRADACRCAPPVPEVVALLVSLLDDLHVAVADAAACALGRMGRPEAAPALSRLIQVRPTAAAIEAIAPIADGNVIVLLGRIARAQPSLADAVLDALDDIDTPQAAAVATSIRRNNGMERGDGTLTTAPVRRFDGPDAQLTEVRIRS